MARSFVRVSNQYLYIGDAVVVGDYFPITLGCWFRSDDTTVNQNLISLSSEDTNWNGIWLMARGGDAGDPVAARLNGTGGLSQALTTSGYSANTSHYATAVYAAANDRRAYIDGGSRGNDTVNITAVSRHNVTIGATYYWNGTVLEVDAPMSGRICEPAIWNAALTDLEVAALARGAPSFLIRPMNLKAYWPLGNDDRDWAGRNHMTPVNSPAWAPGPPAAFDYERRLFLYERVVLPLQMRLGVR